MKFATAFVVYALVFSASIVVLRFYDHSIAAMLSSVIAMPLVIILPYIITVHIFYAVFRKNASPLWLGVPIVLVGAFLGWAAQLTSNSNTALANAKRAHEKLKLERSETCLEFATPVYDRFRSDFTRYLLLPAELREVSRDAAGPSPGCLLVRQFKDIKFSEGKWEYMYVIEGLGENGKVETIGQIQWGSVSYPYFPPIFKPTAYGTVSGSAGGVEWFSKNRYFFLGANVYPDGNFFEERLNYFLATELGRVMGRKVGPYVRGW